ncbi:MAG: glycosyltransferase family 39 protein [Acidobacteriaceae bacterium]
MDEDQKIEEYAPWLVILLTLVGYGLRVLLIGNKGLSLDETLSIWASSHNLADMLPWIAKIDHHPPLYYLLLHYWMAIDGTAASGVRLLSALFGAGTIPFIYLIGKRMSGVLMGLAAAVLLALSPFNIRFAQETRMYTLLTFNAAVAIYALVRLLTDTRSAMPIGSQLRDYAHVWRTAEPAEPDLKRDFSYKDESRNQSGWRAMIFRHRWLPIQAIETDLTWVAFIVFSAATMLSHNTAVLFLLATNIFVLGLMLFQRMRKPESLHAFQAPSFWNWVKAQVGIFILWSPWLLTFIRQASRVYRESWMPRPGWEAVIQTLKSFANEYTLSQASWVMIFWILYALLLCLGLLHYLKKISHFLFLIGLLAIPFLGEWIASLRWPIFSDRTLIWTTIPLLLLLAAGIVQLRFRLLIILVLGICAANNLFSTGDYYRFSQKEDWGGPAGFVANFVHQGDLVLFNATKAQIPFDYYFEPYEKKYLIQVEKHGVPVDMFDSGVLDPIMTESDIPRLVSLISGRKSAWLVYSHYEHTDPMGLIPQTLAAEMKLIYVREYYGVQVQIYAAP